MDDMVIKAIAEAATKLYMELKVQPSAQGGRAFSRGTGEGSDQAFDLVKMAMPEIVRACNGMTYRGGTELC
jgi:hypothetical protein